MSLKRATVLEIVESRDDLQIVQTRIDSSGECVRAYNYLALGPSITPDQSVRINTTGIDLGLGTGGVAFVVPGDTTERADVHEAAASTSQDVTPDGATQKHYGHIVKLRYTPLQIVVDSVEEQDSPFHRILQDAWSIEGMPVVCCELHSQMPLVAAAIKHKEPHTTVAYIMTDEAALPLAFSELVQKSTADGLIDQTITCGQAFGGEYEAINLHSALLAAFAVCKAGVVIVAPGPGIVGSGTAFGHSGIAQGEALNAVASLEGKPIAPLRLSWKDKRQRHHALSHHSKTALGKVCLCKAIVPLPGDLSDEQRREVMEGMEESGISKKHLIVPINYNFDTISTKRVTVTTMGRGRDEDPAFFSAAFAAGIKAAFDLTSI